MWTYSDWITLDSDPAAQLTRLNLHIQEVSNKISADIAAHGYSRQNHPLTTYYAELMASKKGLRGATATGSGRTLATFPKR